MITDTTNKSEQHRKIAIRSLMIIIVVGLVTVVIYSCSQQSKVETSTTGVMLSGSCLAIGGIAGFLFGLPQTIASKEQKKTDYLASKNLEEISEWLTKMLVGIGISQMATIKDLISQFINYIKPSLGNPVFATAFCYSITTYFTICGFTFGFLWGRLYMSQAFAESDRLSEISDEIKNIKETQIRAEQSDIEADDIAERLLQDNLALKEQQELIKQLQQTFHSTSTNMKLQIYKKAEDVRKKNWDSNKQILEKIVPIFEILSNANIGTRYNRKIIASLAYTLKDKNNPSWEKAEQLLTQAIQLHNLEKNSPKGIYEFNRILCNMKLDKDFEKDQPCTNNQIKQKMVEDIKSANTQSTSKKLIRENQDIKKWLDINNMTKLISNHS